MEKRSGLQRGVGVALWRQIADGIRHGIATGLADANGRLPPESRLAERFGVNRHTVRAAISALAHEGVLQSEQGRGTYVRRQKRLVYPIGERTRFSAGLHDQARETRSEMMSAMIEPAREPIASALGLEAGARSIRIESLGTADGVPVSRATSWFDAERFPGIADIYATTGSITEALAACGVADYRRASTGIEARHADEVDRQELRLAPGAIVIVTRALNADLSGTPIQYSVTRFPADRVELVVGTGRAAV
ncbi:phosphonate metabolism transcriptional regulator PhnF [Kumtagia ephedrae]|jgi:GntR family phosphonate transport system transcriptional regulator|uniref:Phosphonate metabolism transcriptional regulator PhnF n=1 Tax=Kumtagia ephedrae TaxID=2116701 RepID=A0A2P7SS43_9HYPH|nr:phosphonate metabolism transcriptional regulator PhnF [Mesorhizobium ephedrae]PSJ65308.1 phosphonate metabolism transcriptional regulator PhnF [Mesorhizobium ephedrae]